MEITEKKNTGIQNSKLLGGLSSWVVRIGDNALSELKDPHSVELPQSEQRRKIGFKNAQTLRNLWDNKRSNIHIIRSQRREERSVGQKTSQIWQNT